MASKEFMDRLIQSCPDGIIGVDREGTVIIFNRSAEKLTGHNAEEILGKLSITQVYDPPELARNVKKAIYSEEYGGVGVVEGMEVEVVGAGGRKVPIRLSATPLTSNGDEVGSVGFFHDLTSRKELEEELRRRSITDSLTGLFNRRHFHSTLIMEVDRTTRYQRPLTIASFDLDGFKAFNDNYGHQEGDTILRLVSETMTQDLRKLDQAFRLGVTNSALCWWRPQPSKVCWPWSDSANRLKKIGLLRCPIWVAIYPCNI